MTVDPIKEAFARAKQDIQSLKDQLLFLTEEISEIKKTLDTLIIIQQTNTPTENQHQQTNQHINMTDNFIDSNTQTHNLLLYSLKSHLSDISSGNEGVPTDRQTNQQTDRHTHFTQEIQSKERLNEPLEKVTEILDSLKNLKEELRDSFKKLTKQELLVFSTIYQLEEEGFIIDYSTIAKKLSLTESSIRDYTLKIIKKGIPLQKTKENNKKILLTIPKDFKRIASLQAILSIMESQ